LANKICVEDYITMPFTVGQSVNVQEGGSTLSGTIIRIKAMGITDSVVVKFADNSQKAFFGSSVDKITAV